MDTRKGSAMGGSTNARGGFLRSAFLTTSAHLSKILAGFLLLKFIAVYVGVEGMGQLGNFMSVMLFMSLLAGGGIQNGVIKYVAEFKTRPRILITFLADAKAYSLFFCLIILVATVFFHVPLAHFLFKSEGYGWLILMLGLFQFVFAFINIVNGTANGLQQTQVYAGIQIVGNLLSLPTAWWLISTYGLIGAVLALVVFYLSYSLPAFYFYVRSNIRRSVRWRAVSWRGLKRLRGFTLMAVVGAISVPVVEIIVRNLITEKVGLDAAGLWQASIKLSSAYMGFFVVFLAAYFMPIVSAQQDRMHIARTVYKFIALIMVLFFVGATVFFRLRESLIPLLLSPEFSELTSYIHYQLIGDFLRVSAYVVGFVVVAKAGTSIYIVSEVGQGSFFCLFSFLALRQGWGLQGVFLAHIAMNAIYVLCALIGFYYYSRRRV